MLEGASIQKAKRSLAAVVREERAGGRFTVADAVDLALDVCDALSSAHQEGIVHGDLGPHSVRLAWPLSSRPAPDGRLKAIEIFSLERESEEDDASLSGAVIALEGAYTGAQGANAKSKNPFVRVSPFLAPEQRSGGMIDARADIWSLGALLRWMLRLDTKTSTAPRGTPSPALLGVIEQCLSPNSADRPQTVDELAEKLASFASAPAIRFERLADRRQAAEEAVRALSRGEKQDAVSALERLDANAMHREREALGKPPAADDKNGWAASAGGRLLETVSKVARLPVGPDGSRMFPASAVTEEEESNTFTIADESDIFTIDDDEAETRLAIDPHEDPLARPLPATPLLTAPAPVSVPVESVGKIRSSVPPKSLSKTPVVPAVGAPNVIVEAGPRERQERTPTHFPPRSSLETPRSAPPRSSLETPRSAPPRSSISPVSVSLESTPLPVQRGAIQGAPLPAPVRAQVKTDPDLRAMKKRGRTAIAIAAAAFATIAVGAAVGAGTSLLSASNAKAQAAAPAAPPPAPSPLPAAAPTEKVITPASLPNANASIPTMTPNALPNAPAPHKKRVAPASSTKAHEGDAKNGDVLEDGIGQ